MGNLISKIIYYAPLVVAPFVLLIFSMVSAYVYKFRLAKGGLGFDYIIFTVIILLGLKLGGAI